MENVTPIEWMQIVGIVIIVVLIVLPPKWDPAIRWKERNEKQRYRKMTEGKH